MSNTGFPDTWLQAEFSGMNDLQRVT